ncbi:four helix bundle protein [Owenweeksia hongkongensis]|uniref:four helix bundle protein n=1 Tax=Owenweeksia hongkongensis TaxID=253245 RepID=UPI003A909E92
MRNFKKLLIWQKGMEIVKATYELTNKLPTEEKFGLTSQMRRCAISVPSNIAEGSCDRSKKHYQHYIEIATGSSFELETQALICKEIGFVSEEHIQPLLLLIEEEQKMLTSFINKLKD